MKTASRNSKHDSASVCGSEVVKLYKSNDNKFFELTASTYSKAYNAKLKRFGVGGTIHKNNQKNVKSYKYVSPYIKKGKLSFIAHIGGVPSDGDGYIVYDGSTKKYSVL